MFNSFKLIKLSLKQSTFDLLILTDLEAITMKNTIGLIFLFAVINVSYESVNIRSYVSTLRELNFIESWYTLDDIPKLVLTSMVNRRINKVKTLYESFSIYKDTKTFYNATEQSLNLLLNYIDSNNTRIMNIFNRYSGIVGLIFKVAEQTKIHNFDYLNVGSHSSFPRKELQGMLDGYIDDIEMVRKCELSLGRPDRVDMKIVDRLKSLSNELQNYHFYRDDITVSDGYSISQKTLDQCLWQLDFLLVQFFENFRHSNASQSSDTLTPLNEIPEKSDSVQSHAKSSIKIKFEQKVSPIQTLSTDSNLLG